MNHWYKPGWIQALCCLLQLHCSKPTNPTIGVLQQKSRLIRGNIFPILSRWTVAWVSLYYGRSGTWCGLLQSICLKVRHVVRSKMLFCIPQFQHQQQFSPWKLLFAVCKNPIKYSYQPCHNPADLNHLLSPFWCWFWTSAGVLSMSNTPKCVEKLIGSLDICVNEQLNRCTYWSDSEPV